MNPQPLVLETSALHDCNRLRQHQKSAENKALYISTLVVRLQQICP